VSSVRAGQWPQILAIKKPDDKTCALIRRLNVITEYEGSTFDPDDLRPDDRQRILWRLPRHILPWIRSPTISRCWVVPIRRWLPLVWRRTSLVASFADSSSVWLMNFLGLWSFGPVGRESPNRVGGGKVAFPPMGNPRSTSSKMSG
jgi:hypothetical protein